MKLILLLGVALLGPVSADITSTIDPTANRGTWEAWGVSLAWWAKIFGTRTDLADVFFTLKQAPYNGVTLPGLGLNMVRYNAGASSAGSVNGTTMAANSILPSRKMDGFWVDSASTSPTSKSWDWGVDAGQRGMLGLAKARGVDRFELFSNSPMWWMLANRNPAGASGGGENILPAFVGAHAVYLATVAKYAHDNWGVTFASVEAFNEPSSGWWTATNNQEGSHFSVPTMAQVVAALRTELNSRGLGSTLVAASDENTYDLAVSTWNGFASSTRGNVGRINVHGYEGTGGRRDLLYTAAVGAGKEIWNSEYGDGDATGMQLAQNLLLDFSWLHPTAWTYWQAVDTSGWGLIAGTLETAQLGGVAKKYYVLAQFTRHIREGMRILDSGSENVVAAYDAAGKKLVIVAANFGAAQNIVFDLSRFSKASSSGAVVARWSTHMSSGEQYVAYSDTFMSGTKFSRQFDTNTIQTFEVSNVSL